VKVFKDMEVKFDMITKTEGSFRMFASSTYLGFFFSSYPDWWVRPAYVIGGVPYYP